MGYIMWEVEAGYIQDWFRELDEDAKYSVVAALNVLAEYGPSLKRPLVGSVAGSEFANMKELRPPSPGQSEIRILFAFDYKRRAVLLLGGDKRGKWNDWYREAVPKADALFREHQRKFEEDGDVRHR